MGVAPPSLVILPVMRMSVTGMPNVRMIVLGMIVMRMFTVRMAMVRMAAIFRSRKMWVATVAMNQARHRRNGTRDASDNRGPVLSLAKAHMRTQIAHYLSLNERILPRISK